MTSEHGLTVTPNANPRMSFSDVSSADWFYDDVFHVCSNGLMDGVSETAFNPNGTVTRAMAVTIIYRLAGEPDMPRVGLGLSLCRRGRRQLVRGARILGEDERHRQRHWREYVLPR